MAFDDRIQEELLNHHSLGYPSDRADAGLGFRKISVAVKERAVTIHAREGYYARQ